MACETVCNGHHNSEWSGLVDNEVDDGVDEGVAEEVMGWQPPGSSPVAPS